MTSIFYDKFNVITYFLLGIVVFVLPVVSILTGISKNILLIFPIVLLLTLGGYFYFRICKAIYHIIANKPMIEFNHDGFIDNLNGVEIKWRNVTVISFEEIKSPFAVFYLKDKSLFYNQLNLLKRLFYKFEGNWNGSFRINLRFTKGKSKEIFYQINKNYQTVNK